jgi:hypothetical protein
MTNAANQGGIATPPTDGLVENDQRPDQTVFSSGMPAYARVIMKVGIHVAMGDRGAGEFVASAHGTDLSDGHPPSATVGRLA